ncbi:MAG: XRE family transcriptional regulator [Candidatus Omnitrophica bacterium]|jgi:hypothetical protein|nr:XRE family transcriptional regulator [Candidatus Omnitrophota bacterium]
MNVGQKIKQYLDENRIQQTWLSIESKIALPKLNLALSGKRRLKFEEYEVICGILDVPVSKFLSPRLPEPQKVC